MGSRPGADGTVQLSGDGAAHRGVDLDVQAFSTRADQLIGGSEGLRSASVLGSARDSVVRASTVAIDGLSIRGAADRRASSTRQPCSANPTAESAAPVRSSATSPSTRGAATDAVLFIATLSSEVRPSDCKVKLLPDAEPADPQSSEIHRRANGMTVEVRPNSDSATFTWNRRSHHIAALGKVVDWHFASCVDVRHRIAKRLGSLILSRVGRGAFAPVRGGGYMTPSGMTWRVVAPQRA